MQFLCITATPYIVHLLKSYRFIECLVNTYQLHMLSINLCIVKFKVCIFGKEIPKPVLQFLFTFLFKLKTNRSSHNLVRNIINSPNHIGIISVVQCRTIGKRTNVFTNHHWLAIIMLKLNPSHFLGKLAEFFY